MSSIPTTTAASPTATMTETSTPEAAAATSVPASASSPSPLSQALESATTSTSVVVSSPTVSAAMEDNANCSPIVSSNSNNVSLTMTPTTVQMAPMATSLQQQINNQPLLQIDDLEEVLLELNRFEKSPTSNIPTLLERYMVFVAKTGSAHFTWTKVKPLFRAKLDNVIVDFATASPTDAIPPVPNVDVFNFAAIKEKVFEQLDAFAGIPFTVQRLAELLTTPRRHYKRTDKFMRALEKNMLIVSTVEARPTVNANVVKSSFSQMNHNNMVNGTTDHGNSQAPLTNANESLINANHLSGSQEDVAMKEVDTDSKDGSQQQISCEAACPVDPDGHEKVDSAESFIGSSSGLSSKTTASDGKDLINPGNKSEAEALVLASNCENATASADVQDEEAGNVTGEAGDAQSVFAQSADYQHSPEKAMQHNSTIGNSEDDTNKSGSIREKPTNAEEEAISASSDILLGGSGHSHSTESCEVDVPEDSDAPEPMEVLQTKESSDVASSSSGEVLSSQERSATTPVRDNKSVCEGTATSSEDVAASASSQSDSGDHNVDVASCNAVDAISTSQEAEDPTDG